MQVRNVAESHERLRLGRHEVVVDQRQHFDGTGSTPEAEDDVDVVVLDQGVQVVHSILRGTGHVVEPGPDAVGKPHLVTARFEPLDGSQDVAAVLIRTRRREDADSAALRKWPSESRRLHEANTMRALNSFSASLAPSSIRVVASRRSQTPHEADAR